MPENQHWHPFRVQRLAGRWELQRLYGITYLPLFCWFRLTDRERRKIWVAIIDHQWDFQYDREAVLWDLFPSNYRRKNWELFLLNEAARGLKEAASGQ